jgi:DNA-binding response OmpR family regulator
LVEHRAKGQLGCDLGRTEDFDAAIWIWLAGHSRVVVLRRWRRAGREMPVLIWTARVQLDGKGRRAECG